MPHAVTILADGFEEIEAVTVIDLLRRGGIDVTILGLDGTEVRGAHDIWVLADMALRDFSGVFDALVLPGGMPGTNNLAASEEVLEMVRMAYNRGKTCAAICSAPMVFARAGILDGKKATCYPGCEAMLAGAQLSEDAVVVDGNIITSRAVGTAIQFALKLVTVMAGKDAAKKINTAILH
ncbi:MAG: DJ-1/PfpI family protein [Chitinispirillia bacterium]|nr:DJ-1/PfpI family protein [Chitinispirillia bacterium]MCL2242657.1 DJ-1/PfpI family protein [Chitinispirillia bacterium]